MSNAPTVNRAVVLGGSVAGLLAAAALAGRFGTVTVVERDRLQPQGFTHRRGTPQGHHVHGLLPQGLRIIEELLPGCTDRLVAAGALPGDVLAHIRWYLNGRRLKPVRTGLTAMSASRPLLEQTIRDMVLDLPNVTLLDGHDVVGVSTDGHTRITGARVTSRHGAGSRVLPADLVVDATGRGSRAPRWFAELGLPGPAEDTVRIDLTYTSRLFDVPDGLFGDDIVVVTARYPGQRRSAVVQRLESGRALVTLAGVHGERAPGDLAGFAWYAASLPVTDTLDVIRAGTPAGDAVSFRVPAYVRRRYEHLSVVPDGLLVVGDAACALNPIYGQGMTVAAMCAGLLRTPLEPAAFFAAQARVLDAPWFLAAGADAGEQPEALRRLQLAAVDDGDLATAFIRVTSMVDPPSADLVEASTGRE